MGSGHADGKRLRMGRGSLRVLLGEEVRSGKFVRLSESVTYNHVRGLKGEGVGMRRTSRPVVPYCQRRTTHRLPMHHYVL